jgi:hypothetical protein
MILPARSAPYGRKISKKSAANMFAALFLRRAGLPNSSGLRPFFNKSSHSRVMIGISPFSFPFLGQNNA